MIKNIIFDFGDVLLKWDPHFLYDKYFDNREKADWFLQNICTYSWNCQMDAGKPWDDGLDELIEKFPEYEKDIRVYRERWKEMLLPVALPAADYLKELKNRGYRIYGLTNWSSDTYDMIQEDYDFFKYLDGVVVSGKEKISKPDLRIYDILLKRYRLNPVESVFIDDNPANLEGAEKSGIKGIRFYDARRLRTDLEMVLCGVNNF